MNRKQAYAAAFTAITAFASVAPVAAQEFAAVVSPPRFEISAQPGERVRQVVEITNVAPQPSRFLLRTADWSLGPDGAVTFAEDVVPGSCREWVAIERHEIEVPGGGRYRYRFEVQPPAGAPAGECRFALMVEGEPTTIQTEGGLPLPVSGRIGVIVYVAVGAASADLQVVGTGVADTAAGSVPVLSVRNVGNAHGRLDGFLTGADARGRRLEFSPASLPILPGETRTIALSAHDGKEPVSDLAFPVKVAGTIEWGDGRSISIDQPFGH